MLKTEIDVTLYCFFKDTVYSISSLNQIDFYNNDFYL